jgi:hypothetical protein
MTSDGGADDLEAQVETLLVTAGNLDEGALIAMKSIWDVGDAARRQRAWSKAKPAIESRGLTEVLDGARFRLSTWTDTRSKQWMRDPTNRFEGRDVRRSSIPPLLDALAVILAGDELDDDERQELLEPLRAVTEREAPTDE